MTRRIAHSLIIVALTSMVGGAAMAAEYETYGPTSQRVRVAEASKTRIPQQPPARANGEEDMEYKALVEPPKKEKMVMQPGDVAVQWNGPKMKISLGL